MKHPVRPALVRVTPTENRVLVGMCMAETVYARFFEHIFTIDGWDTVMRGVQRGAYLPDNHNKLVEGALKVPGWDYLLWIEQDTLPPKDILKRVKRYKEPIVGGLYFRRAMPPDPVAFDDDGGKIRPVLPEWLLPKLEKPGIYPVDIVPMGCTAIRRDVLEAMGEKWYAASFDNDGFTMSDDMYFCRRARELGFQPYLDTGCVCTHLGTLEYDVNMYLKWANIQQHSEELADEAEKGYDPKALKPRRAYAVR